METILYYLYHALLGFIPIFIWEYVAKRKQSNIKPSYVLDKVATGVTDFFYAIGRILAKLSSFYTFIDYKELLGAFSDLISPLIKIVTFPYHFCKGYADTALIYNHPYIVGFGSVTLLVLIGWVWYMGRFFVIWNWMTSWL